MRAQSWLILAGFLILCFGAAASGARVTHVAVQTWYPTLRKPTWNPPAWIFGPVWTVLYLLMAVAAWCVWQQTGRLTLAGPLGIFLLQLLLNAAWSPLFFGLRNPLAGLIDVGLLWGAIGWTLITFWQVTPLAGALLIPYWLWVSFATVLNFVIWRLNR